MVNGATKLRSRHTASPFEAPAEPLVAAWACPCPPRRFLRRLRDLLPDLLPVETGAAVLGASSSSSERAPYLPKAQNSRVHGSVRFG